MPNAVYFIKKFAIYFIATTTLNSVHAQPVGQAAAGGANVIALGEWLSRMQEASMKSRTYVGTVVQTAQGMEGMSSARIWHACDGFTQAERMESLTGAPRSTVRVNDRSVTLLPELKLARFERRDGFVSSGNFTEFLKPQAQNVPEYYSAKSQGIERVAGLEADVVQLQGRDNLRFGYRMWVDRKSAMVLKLQTLDLNGAVLEQTAFSELQLDAPVKVGRLKRMMDTPTGWKEQHSQLAKTSASAEGWEFKGEVPGFKPVGCLRREALPMAMSQAAGDSGGKSSVQQKIAAAAENITQFATKNIANIFPTAATPAPRMSSVPAAPAVFQCLFSDGLATVSLFVEPFDRQRHSAEGMAASGATYSQFRRMNDHFLSVVGEVPPATLRQFASLLQRKN
jgi:sigma-E factor negative regulatory protein RseB